MANINQRDADLAEIARMKKRICAFSNQFRETEARCRKPFFPADPCDVHPDDLRQWPGWRTPEVGYNQCLLESSMAKPQLGDGGDGGDVTTAAGENKCPSDSSPPLHPPSSAMAGAGGAASFRPSGGARPECECKCGSPSGGGAILILFGDGKRQKTDEDGKEKNKPKDECEEMTKAASCPSRDMPIGRRIIYDKKNGMIPGYAGHVPAIRTCSYGGNWGNETRKVLKRTFSDPKLKLKHGNL